MRLLRFARNDIALFLCFIFVVNGLHASTIKLEITPSQITAWQSFILVDRLSSNVFLGIPLTVTPAAPTVQEFSRLPPKRQEELKIHLWLASKNQEKYKAYLRLNSINPYGLDWKKTLVLLGLNPDQAAKEIPQLNLHYKPEPGPAAYLFVNGQEVPLTWDLTKLAVAINERLPKTLRRPHIKESVEQEEALPPVEALIISGVDLAPWAKVDDQNLETLKRLPFKLETRELNVSEPEARKMLLETQTRLVPAVFLKTKDPKAQEALDEFAGRGAVEKRGPGKDLYFVRAFSSNGIVWDATDQTQKELKLFIMSQCPYGVTAQKAMMKARSEGKFPEDVSFNTHFIVNRSSSPQENGQYNFGSLHGKAELEENTRQLVAREYFKDKFPCYVAERLKAIDSSLWMDALEACKIDGKKFQTLFKENEQELLNKEYGLTQAYGIGSSPTFLWENRYLLVGLDGLKNIPEFKDLDLKSLAEGSLPASGKCQ